MSRDGIGAMEHCMWVEGIKGWIRRGIVVTICPLGWENVNHFDWTCP